MDKTVDFGRKWSFWKSETESDKILKVNSIDFCIFARWNILLTPSGRTPLYFYDILVHLIEFLHVSGWE